MAAAINVDNEDPFFESEDENFSDDDDYGETSNAVMDRQRSASPLSRHLSSTMGSPPRSRRSSLGANRTFTRSPASPSTRKLSNSGVPFSRFPSLTMTAANEISPGQPRHMSSSHVLLPAIYANTGVNTPPALLDALGISNEPTPQGERDDPFQDTLAPIVEGQVSGQEPTAVEDTHVPEKRPEGFKWTALPLFIILQYFVLALHSTSHDQVFLMYLTS